MEIHLKLPFVPKLIVVLVTNTTNTLMIDDEKRIKGSFANDSLEMKVSHQSYLCGQHIVL